MCICACVCVRSNAVPAYGSGSSYGSYGSGGGGGGGGGQMPSIPRPAASQGIPAFNAGQVRAVVGFRYLVGLSLD